MKQRIIASLFLLVFSTHTILPAANPKPEDGTNGKPKIQVALLLDTSGSMDGLIEQAKSQLWKIVNELAKASQNGEKASIEIALYHYGNDLNESNKGYIKQLLPFTTDLDKVSAELFALKTNGGEEYCGQMIEAATNELKWSDDQQDLKLIYICGNEPFNQGTVDYKKTCLAAYEKGIFINTIFCGNPEEGVRTFWKDGAQISSGEYLTIAMDEKTFYVETPYDSTLKRLNTKLNSTYVYYGTNGLASKKNQESQDDNARIYSEANESERTVAKASGAYVNSSWDLVDATKEKDFDYKKIKNDDLPEELKNKNADEIKKYIDEKSAERERIKIEINNTNQLRLAYIEKEKEKLGEDNSLEKAVINSVHIIANKKNYLFQ